MVVIRIKPAYLSALVILLGCASSATAQKDLAEYPLRVHIFKSEWVPERFYGTGSGMANLYDGQSVHGIEFVYDCNTRYMDSVGNQAYGAKWKKPEKSIEIVSKPVVGTGHTDKCEFKISMHEYVYDLQNGTLTTFTQEQYKARMGVAIPKGEVVDGDITHYPLRLSVLKIDWAPAANGTRTGFGRGNLMNGTTPSSVDFTTNCTTPFSITPEGKSYAAQWQQEGSQMKLLLRSASGSAALACLLNTSTHTDVYVSDGAGGVKAISPQEYQQIKKP
jgi:hypothetical protein